MKGAESRPVSVLRKRAFVALLLIGIVAFWMVRAVGVWLKTDPAGFGDLMMYYLPGYDYAADRLRAGEFPLWNPYELCGVPFMAMLQYGCLYPLHAVQVLLSPVQGFFAVTAIHLLIGLSGVYCLCRVLGLSRSGSLVAATVFCLSGWALFNSLVYPDAFRSGVWMPWAMAAADMVARRRRVVWAVLLGLVLSLILLAGEAEIAARMAFLVSAYAVVVAATSAAGENRLISCATAFGLVLLAGLVSMGTTAAQLLPTAEAWLMSARAAHGVSYDAVAGWGAVHPNLMAAGLVYALPHVPPAYIGIVPLVLAVAGLSYGRRKPVLVFLTVLALLSLALGTGDHCPLWRLLFRLPGGSLFRYPHKFLAYFALSASVLAGMGTDRISEAAISTDGRRARSLLAPLLPGALLVLVIGSLIFMRVFPGGPSRELLVSRGWCRADLNNVALGLAAAAVGLMYLGRVSVSRFWPLIVPVMMLPPLLMFDMWAYLPARAVDIYKLPETVESQLDAAGHDRVYVDLSVKGKWHLPKYGLVHRRHSLGGYEPLTPADFAQFCQPMYRRAAFREKPLGEQANIGLWGGLSSDLPAGRLLDMLAVRRVAVNPGSEMFGVKEVGGKLTFSYDAARFRQVLQARTASVFESVCAMPRAYFVSRARRVSGTAQAVEEIMKPGFDPLKEVLLERDFAGMVDEVNGSATVEFIEDLPERIVLRTNSTGPGFVVLADQFYPGWTAKVDGKPTPIYRANGLFRSVPIVGGEQRIEFDYRPISFRAGSAISLLTLVLITVIGALRGRRFLKSRFR